MTARGFAVLDFETTGLGADQTDRVIEIAVVLVSETGVIEGRFETLINPGRDIGPTHIHGIYDADVRHAPTFAQALPQLTAVLRGRVLVAHNLAFDSRFLAAEMLRAGYRSPINLTNSLCTMILSKSFLSIDSKSLAACCTAAGITLVDAHRASADAYATALLLASYIGEHGDWDGWETAVDAAAGAWWPEALVSGVPLVTRERAADRAAFAHRVTGGTPGIATAEDRVDYLVHVDRCLSIFEPDPQDVVTLLLFVGVVGLTWEECATLNLAHFHALAADAWSDGILTDAEQRNLVAAARLFGLVGPELTAALRPPALPDAAPLTLEPGAKIVLTGFSAADKRALGTLIEAAGHVVWPSLVKTTGLLVATDTDSLSTKGRTARRFGVPITDEAGLRELLADAV